MEEIQIGQSRKPILRFPDGSFIYQCRGKFDGFMFKLNNYAVKDIDYFTVLKQLADKYSVDKVYNDFVTVYNLVGININSQHWLAIRNIAETYNKKDFLVVAKLFCILYVTMLAEQNNAHAILGKRIKRLGVYQILKQNMPIIKAVNFSKGKSARYDLEPLCEKYDF